MLGAHPRIYSIPFETNAFLHNRAIDEARSVIAVAERHCNKRAHLICEKTPRHVHHIDRMAQAFPGARFILCLRDPRDVVCSIKRRTGNLKSGIRRWERDNQKILSLIKRHDCFLLRYEELISSPNETLENMCSFVGIRFDRSILEYWQDNRDWFGVNERRDTDGSAGENHVIRRNWQIHQPLMKDRIGVWRRELSCDEVILIRRQLEFLAIKLNYDLTEAP